MAGMRVSVGRLTVGVGKERQVIQPGQRFDPAKYNIDDKELREMESRGVVRKPRDDSIAVSDAAGPTRSSAEPTTEGRSGPVSDATSDMPNKQDTGAAEEEESKAVTNRRAGRSRSSDDEL
jgi:hypothetical protein